MAIECRRVAINFSSWWRRDGGSSSGGDAWKNM